MAQLDVEAPDPEGSIVKYPSGSIKVGEDSKELSVLFKMGRLEGTLRARLFGDDNRVIWQRTLRVSGDPDSDLPSPLRQSVFLVGHLVSTNEAGQPQESRIRTRLMSDSSGQTGTGSDSATHPQIDVVDVDSHDSLPTDPAAYSSLDALFLNGRVDIDQARSQAIEQWVRSGGHLVAAVGNVAKTFPTSPLAAWLPVKVTGAMQLRDLSAVESFCRQSARIMAASDEPIAAARLKSTEGRPLIQSLDGVLLYRLPYGLGRITVLGFDIDAPQLRRWNSLGDLLRRLFDIEDVQAKRTQSTAARLTQTGINELATQLDASQDDFPSVARVTTWSVMGLLVALLLVVGPIDFLLVHKVLKRPELTWITFPVFAVLAAGLAIFWGSSSKGERLLVNQLDIVDLDAASGSMRSESYSLVYSPQNRRYQIGGDADPLAPPSAWSKVRIGWHGRPESSFGGMYRAGGAEISRPGYSAEAADRGFEDLPITVWGTRPLDAEWEGSRQDLVESRLESRGPGHLGGTFRHHFPEPIDDWIVAYGRQVFRPPLDPETDVPLSRPIASGIPWSPQSSSQRELAGYLTAARLVEVELSSTGHKINDEKRIEHADYDPLNRDPLDIMRMLSFHAMAGGTSYTGLGNGALRNFDWTPLLDLNRAVLVGRLRKPMMHWKVDGQAVEPEQSSTFVRVVLPVRLRNEMSGN